MVHGGIMETQQQRADADPHLEIRRRKAARFSPPKFVVIATQAHATPGRIFSEHATRGAAMLALMEELRA